MMSETTDTNDLIAVRRSKLAALRAAGEDPFQANWAQTHTSADVLRSYEETEAAFLAANPEAPAALEAHRAAQAVVDEARAAFRAKMAAGEVPAGTPFTPPVEVPPAPDLPEGPEVSVAGRIVAIRDMGKATFVKLLDRAGTLQVYATRDALGEAPYRDRFKKLDLGDFIGVCGPTFRTKTGEVTIRATAFGLVSKALRPLPEKFHGITDSEQIYRQRYLDLISNPESRQRFQHRSQIIRGIREYLWARDFTEVETPCLHAVAGGAAARPFTTHFNALDCDFYLRIALELHLKRLLVGGFDRVFELGRVFRNEGLSRRHNPEFTMLEVYQAYSDHRGMMDLVRGLLHSLCDHVLGTRQIVNSDGVTIDLDGPWRELPYRDAIVDLTQDPDWFTRPKAEKLAAAARLGLHLSPEMEDFEITNDLFGKLIEPTLLQPTFVTRLPKELCPLAKLHPSGDGTLEVFELCINGQEIAPAYSEQNDPDIQRQMFLAQVGEETQKLDEDFLVALEHGMPPAGGMGIGIDRLVILLTGAANIRDTILFPSLRPEQQ